MANSESKPQSNNEFVARCRRIAVQSPCNLTDIEQRRKWMSRCTDVDSGWSHQGASATYWLMWVNTNATMYIVVRLCQSAAVFKIWHYTRLVHLYPKLTPTKFNIVKLEKSNGSGHHFSTLHILKILGAWINHLCDWSVLPFCQFSVPHRRLI